MYRDAPDEIPGVREFLRRIGAHSELTIPVFDRPGGKWVLEAFFRDRRSGWAGASSPRHLAARAPRGGRHLSRRHPGRPARDRGAPALGGRADPRDHLRRRRGPPAGLHEPADQVAPRLRGRGMAGAGVLDLARPRRRPGTRPGELPRREPHRPDRHRVPDARRRRPGDVVQRARPSGDRRGRPPGGHPRGHHRHHRPPARRGGAARERDAPRPRPGRDAARRGGRARPDRDRAPRRHDPGHDRGADHARPRAAGDLGRRRRAGDRGPQAGAAHARHGRSSEPDG